MPVASAQPTRWPLTDRPIGVPAATAIGLRRPSSHTCLPVRKTTLLSSTLMSVADAGTAIVCSRLPVAAS